MLGQRGIKIYCKKDLFACCCLKMISRTLKASCVCSDSLPWSASVMDFSGILAAKLIPTLNSLDSCERLNRFLSPSAGLPLPGLPPAPLKRTK